MTKVLLIDDEPLATELVREYLSDYPEMEVVGVAHDGFAGVKAVQELQPDLIFLDVQMPRINGLEMLELLELPPAVIFTTAFDEYALKAFEANAIDYLLKPFSKERFAQAIQKFLARESTTAPDLAPVIQTSPELKNRNRVVIRDGGRIRIIPIREVSRLEADGDYVLLHTSQGKFMKKKTLQYYEDTLPSNSFIRVHRSHLINVSHIERIDPYQKNNHLALLKDGSRIPVSRSGYQRMKEALNLG